MDNPTFDVIPDQAIGVGTRVMIIKDTDEDYPDMHGLTGTVVRKYDIYGSFNRWDWGVDLDICHSNPTSAHERFPSAFHRLRDFLPQNTGRWFKEVDLRPIWG